MMETVTTEADGISTTEDVEAIMGGLFPAEPSAELFSKLSMAFETGLSDSAGIAEPDTVEGGAIGEMIPVTVPEDKLKQWTKLMDQTAREVIEERLKDLKAASPAEFKLMRWLMSVENTSTPSVEKDTFVHDIPPHKRLKLWAMSAAATFMLILGVLSFYRMDSENAAFVQKGDINRETLNIVDEGVHWNAEKGIAEKKYHVDYMDTLELVDKDGSLMEITLPSAQKVAVPVEIY